MIFSYKLYPIGSAVIVPFYYLRFIKHTNMTYQEKHDELLQKVSGSWNDLLEDCKIVSANNGFGDFDSLPKFDKAYTEWQDSSGKYTYYISWLKGQGRYDPNAELS